MALGGFFYGSVVLPGFSLGASGGFSSATLGGFPRLKNDLILSSTVIIHLLYSCDPPLFQAKKGTSDAIFSDSSAFSHPPNSSNLIYIASGLTLCLQIKYSPSIYGCQFLQNKGDDSFCMQLLYPRLTVLDICLTLIAHLANLFRGLYVQGGFFISVSSKYSSSRCR